MTNVFFLFLTEQLDRLCKPTVRVQFTGTLKSTLKQR